MKDVSTIIIAEAGVNHNGSIALAKKLIDIAADAGADYVKFQTFKAKNLVSQYVEKAEYQKKSSGGDDSQFEMIKKLELDQDAHEVLIAYCEEKNIQFLSTAFDHRSIDMLEKFDIPFYKIPSGEITNLPYLRHIGRMGKPIIMSTGMSTLNEIKEALEILLTSGSKKDNITILHCNTEYPTPMKDVNLKAMLTIKEKFDISIGYSDHTLGTEVSIAAVALGAKVIEKHFTIDRKMEGPDHAASLEPKELKEMINSIRNIEIALGGKEKLPSASEIKNIEYVRKSIVAKKFIKKGELFTENNLTVKRPGLGISPMMWDSILGKKAKKSFDPEELIK